MSAKLEIMKVSAALTAGAATNLPDDLKRGADGKLDPSITAENLIVWELFKTFYGGIVANFNDQAAFPEPPPEAETPAAKELLDKLLALIPAKT